jgi:hypothetical protein
MASSTYYFQHYNSDLHIKLPPSVEDYHYLNTFGASCTLPLTVYYTLYVRVVTRDGSFKATYGECTVSRTRSSGGVDQGYQYSSIMNGALPLQRTDKIQAKLRISFSQPLTPYETVWATVYEDLCNFVSFGSISEVCLQTYIGIGGYTDHWTGQGMIRWGGQGIVSYLTFSYENAMRIMSVKTPAGVLGIAGRTIAQGESGFNQIRMRKNGTNYIVENGLTTDYLASPVRVKTASGIRSLLKLS